MVGSDHGRWTRHGNTREWNGFKGEVKREHTRRKNAWMDGWMFSRVTLRRTTKTIATMTMTFKTAMTPTRVMGATGTKGRRRGGLLRGATRVTTTRAEMGPELKGSIDKFIAENKVVLFMKGTKEAPRCGFSNTCVQILNSMNVPFADVDILANEDLRQGMKEYSNWPTFPQLYVGGEFFGGCDITVDAFKDGSLKEELERAMLE